MAIMKFLYLKGEKKLCVYQKKKQNKNPVTVFPITYEVPKSYN
jgi:hypothetical protein